VGVITNLNTGVLGVPEEPLSEEQPVNGPTVAGFPCQPLANGNAVAHARRVDVNAVDRRAKLFADRVWNASILQVVEGDSFAAHFVSDAIACQALEQQNVKTQVGSPLG
jgi:hypothetical protein